MAIFTERSLSRPLGYRRVAETVFAAIRADLEIR